MNRATRRSKNQRDRTMKKKYSLQDVQRATNIAMEMKKISKGHLFTRSTVARDTEGKADKEKSYCVFCGQSMQTKNQCQYWVLTLLDRMQTVLINPSFYTDDNLQALWLQHGNEYQDIKLPLAVTPQVKTQSATSEKAKHE